MIEVLAETDQRRQELIAALSKDQDALLSDPAQLRLYLTALADRDRSAIGAARIQVENQKAASAEAIQQLFVEMTMRDRQDPFRHELPVPPPVPELPETVKTHRAFSEENMKMGDDTQDVDSFYTRLGLQ